MNDNPIHEPILVEIGEKNWSKMLDQAEQWFDNLRMIQAAYVKHLEDTLEKVHEPHLKDYLNSILERARGHEERVTELYGFIGRKPSGGLVHAAGDLMGKFRQGLADVIGGAGGAGSSPWRDLRELMVVNLDSQGAFAVAEQIGLALALPEIVHVCLPIVNEKATDGLLLQEMMLELAPLAILYNTSFKDKNLQAD